jgi:hypothetical protein
VIKDGWVTISFLKWWGIEGWGLHKVLDFSFPKKMGSKKAVQRCYLHPFSETEHIKIIKS